MKKLKLIHSSADSADGPPSLTPTQTLHAEVQQNIHTHLYCQGNARKMRMGTRKIQLNRLRHKGLQGSKVSQMTTRNPSPKEITLLLLLISSNDVPEGWHPLCQPYCHYNALFPVICILLGVRMNISCRYVSVTACIFPTSAHSDVYFSFMGTVARMTSDSIETQRLHDIITVDFCCL